MVVSKQQQFDFSKAHTDMDEASDYVDVQEDQVINQVSRYLELAGKIARRKSHEVGYIDLGWKAVIIARLIQNSTHGNDN